LLKLHIMYGRYLGRETGSSDRKAGGYQGREAGGDRGRKTGRCLGRETRGYLCGAEQVDRR
jgi:hypothetical protein